MGALQGTTVGGPVVPGDSENDVFATHYDWLANGGWRAVANIAKRNSITALRRAVGMSVYVIDEKKTYKLKGGLTNDDWELSNEIISAPNSPTSTTEIWNGTQNEIKALIASGLLVEGVIYNYEHIETVIRSPSEPVSFILDQFDSNTIQVVMKNCNFALPENVDNFRCKIIIYPNVICNVYAGSKLLQLVKGTSIVSGDQVLSNGIYNLVQIKTEEHFIVC